MANFVFLPSSEALTAYKDYRIARIDGSKVPSLKAFYEAIAQALKFPDYFGFNLDSLDELLNDLSWLEEDHILLYISNSEAFLSQEKNAGKKADLLNLLDATAEDWKWVDETEDDLQPRTFVIAFDPSESLQQLLDQEGFAYTTLS